MIWQISFFAFMVGTQLTLTWVAPNRDVRILAWLGLIGFGICFIVAAVSYAHA